MCISTTAADVSGRGIMSAPEVSAGWYTRGTRFPFGMLLRGLAGMTQVWLDRLNDGLSTIPPTVVAHVSHRVLFPHPFARHCFVWLVCRGSNKWGVRAAQLSNSPGLPTPPPALIRHYNIAVAAAVASNIVRVCGARRTHRFPSPPTPCPTASRAHGGDEKEEEEPTGRVVWDCAQILWDLVADPNPGNEYAVRGKVGRRRQTGCLGWERECLGVLDYWALIPKLPEVRAASVVLTSQR